MNWKDVDANYIAAGPWGGQYGSPWDDGVFSTVRQVVITSAAGIVSIQFEYDNNGSSVWSEKHGGTSGVKKETMKLAYPVEVLVSISGHVGPISESGTVIVRSLSFASNRRKYGPFGVEQGMPFSLPITGGKLVGFHGRSSWYLDSLGVYVKPLSQKYPLEKDNQSYGWLNRRADGNFIGSDKTSYPVSSPLEHQKFFMEEVTGQGRNDHLALSTAQVSTFTPSTKRVLRSGPWGSDSGTTFDDGVYTGVREIRLTRTGGLVSICVCYDRNGRAVWGSKNGGSGGLTHDKIVFDYPSEVLTHISGYYGSTILQGPTVVKSITFHTNKRPYGPFGDQEGIFFSSSESVRGVVVGFHGRRGHFLMRSIGVHVLEDQSLPSQPRRDPFDMSSFKNSEVVWGVPREPTMYSVGPWGGEGGKRWDDGVNTGVKKITLTRGEAICSIQIEYDRYGQSIWAAQHGMSNDACTYLIKLDYPYEFLTRVSGYYDAILGERNKRAIRSLTFHTNKAKYGPYGKEMGVQFSSAAKEGRIVGFHGRSGYFLDAIGVHVLQLEDDEALNKGYPQRGGFRAMFHNILH